MTLNTDNKPTASHWSGNRNGLYRWVDITGTCMLTQQKTCHKPVFSDFSSLGFRIRKRFLMSADCLRENCKCSICAFRASWFLHYRLERCQGIWYGEVRDRWSNFSGRGVWSPCHWKATDASSTSGHATVRIKASMSSGKVSATVVIASGKLSFSYLA